MLDSTALGLDVCVELIVAASQARIRTPAERSEPTHARPTRHPHPRAQVARRAVALRARRRGRRPRRGLVGRLPAGAARGARARELQRHLRGRRGARPRGRGLVPDDSARAERLGRRADRAPLRLRHPPRGGLGRRHRRSSSTRAATRRSRPTSPTSSSPAPRAASRSSWTTCSAGSRSRRATSRRRPDGPRQRYFSTSSTTPASTGRSGSTRPRARTCDDVTVVTGLTARPGRSATTCETAGRRSLEVARHPARRGGRRGGERDRALRRAHRRRRPSVAAGRGLPVRARGRALGRRARADRRLLAGGGHAHRGGRRHALPDQRRAFLLPRLRQARGQRRSAARATTTRSWSTTSR